MEAAGEDGPSRWIQIGAAARAEMDALMITQSLLDIYEREATHSNPNSPWYDGPLSDSPEEEKSAAQRGLRGITKITPSR